MSDDLSMLRYSLKQCEKSVADAKANPRYWEQAAGNCEGLSSKLSQLPSEERAEWKRKLDQWETSIDEGVRLVRGERILRQLNDTLASAAEQIAGNSDASREFDRLERDLSDAEVMRCVPAAERARISGEIEKLQELVEALSADAQATQIADHLKHVEANIDELATWLKNNPGTQNNSLARAISGGLDSAALELDKLPASHPRRPQHSKHLKQLKRRFESL